MGTDKFWNAVTGSNAGSGGPDDPWQTFTGAAQLAFQAAMGPGDRMVLDSSGIFRPTLATLSTWAGFLFTNRSGFEVTCRQPSQRALIQGCAQIPSGSWVNVLNGRFQKNIGAGLDIGRAFFGINETVTVGTNNFPIRQGYMPLGAGLLLTAVGEYYYDTITGFIEVRVGFDPADAVYVAKSGQWNTCTVSGGSGWNVNCLDIAVAGSVLGTGTGYNLQASGCTDAVFRNIIAQFGNNHCIGITSNATQRNSIRDCFAAGCSTSGNLIVYHGDIGNITGTIDNSVVHNSPILKYDGTEASANQDIIGFFTHCNPATAALTDVEYRGCTAYHYGTSNALAPFGNSAGTDSAAFTGDSKSLVGRSVRYIDCNAYNAGYMRIEGAPLFQRCHLDFAKAGPNGAGVTFGTVRIKGPVGNRCPTLPLFDSCELLVNSSSASTVAFFQADNTGTMEVGSGPTFINCTMFDTNTTANFHTFFERGPATNFTIKSYRSIWAGQNSPQLIDSDDGTTVIDFGGNCYMGIGVGGFSSLASRNTFAEWLATVEPTARNFATLAAMGLTRAPTVYLPDNGSPLWNQNGFQGPHTLVGINHLGFMGSVGANQFPTQPGMERAPGAGLIRR